MVTKLISDHFYSFKMRIFRFSHFPPFWSRGALHSKQIEANGSLSTFFFGKNILGGLSIHINEQIEGGSTICKDFKAPGEPGYYCTYETKNEWNPPFLSFSRGMRSEDHSFRGSSCPTLRPHGHRDRVYLWSLWFLCSAIYKQFYELRLHMAPTVHFRKSQF